MESFPSRRMPNLSTAPRGYYWWRRRRRRVVLARPEIRGIAEKLRSVELAAVGRHPRHLRAVRALHRSDAAMADIGSGEARHAAVLIELAHRVGLIEGDIPRGNSSQVLYRRVPALDQHTEVGPREKECAGAVDDLDDASDVENLDAVRALDDGYRAAADADIGRRGGDRLLALVAQLAADEAQRALGQRHQHVAVVGVRIVNIFVDDDL